MMTLDFHNRRDAERARAWGPAVLVISPPASLLKWAAGADCVVEQHLRSDPHPGVTIVAEQGAKIAPPTLSQICMGEGARRRGGLIDAWVVRAAPSPARHACRTARSDKCAALPLPRTNAGEEENCRLRKCRTMPRPSGEPPRLSPSGVVGARSHGTNCASRPLSRERGGIRQDFWKLAGG